MIGNQAVDGSFHCQTSVLYVLCSRLLFPYMVCFLSSFHVIMSLFGSRCVCVIVNYPVYLSPVFEFHFVWSTCYSRCFCVSTLPCLTLMSSLKTIILKYLLVCVFLVSPCCVHRDFHSIYFPYYQFLLSTG